MEEAKTYVLNIEIDEVQHPLFAIVLHEDGTRKVVFPDMDNWVDPAELDLE
jgi:hypothetical protein